MVKDRSYLVTSQEAPTRVEGSVNRTTVSYAQGWSVWQEESRCKKKAVKSAGTKYNPYASSWTHHSIWSTVVAASRSGNASLQYGQDTDQKMELNKNAWQIFKILFCILKTTSHYIFTSWYSHIFCLMLSHLNTLNFSFL